MPEPTLQTTALRYAAGDLTPTEAAAFEVQLANDQNARDAVAEAVRLSAATIGQKSPSPHPSFRAAIRARLSWGSDRGHPLAWVGLGAAAVAACTLIGLSLADRAAPLASTNTPASAHSPTEEIPAARNASIAIAPAPREQTANVAVEHAASSPSGGDPVRSVAEIWADLSSHDNVEKARDDEARWRQRMRDLSHPHHASTVGKADARDP